MNKRSNPLLPEWKIRVLLISRNPPKYFYQWMYVCIVAVCYLWRFRKETTGVHTFSLTLQRDHAEYKPTLHRILHYILTSPYYNVVSFPFFMQCIATALFRAGLLKVKTKSWSGPSSHFRYVSDKALLIRFLAYKAWTLRNFA